MNDRSRMMLYALTAVACVIWIWQSVKEAMTDGTMISTSNIIFSGMHWHRRRLLRRQRINLVVASTQQGGCGER